MWSSPVWKDSPKSTGGKAERKQKCSGAWCLCWTLGRGEGWEPTSVLRTCFTGKWCLSSPIVFWGRTQRQEESWLEWGLGSISHSILMWQLGRDGMDPGVWCELKVAWSGWVYWELCCGWGKLLWNYNNSGKSAFCSQKLDIGVFSLRIGIVTNDAVEFICSEA